MSKTRRGTDGSDVPAKGYVCLGPWSLSVVLCYDMLLVWRWRWCLRFGDNDEDEKGGGLYKIVGPKSKKSQFRDSSGRDILL